MTDAYRNRIATAVPGFDMVLSARVPPAVAAAFPSCLNDIVNGGGIQDCLHWAVHPGGRTVVDAVEEGAGLPKELLVPFRATLRRFGNMSYATVMFVLRETSQMGNPAGRGCAVVFGRDLTSRAYCSKHRAGDS